MNIVQAHGEIFSVGLSVLLSLFQFLLNALILVRLGVAVDQLAHGGVVTIREGARKHSLQVAPIDFSPQRIVDQVEDLDVQWLLHSGFTFGCSQLLEH